MSFIEVKVLIHPVMPTESESTGIHPKVEPGMRISHPSIRSFLYNSSDLVETTLAEEVGNLDVLDAPDFVVSFSPIPEVSSFLFSRTGCFAVHMMERS